jgi:hypothetical protein
MTTATEYRQLTPDQVPQDEGPQRPFLALVIIRDPVTPEWQWAVSKWLVASGCLFMCAWGPDCSSWDDSVDYANMEAFSYGDIPQDRFVMTTWHDDEPLDEAVWFAKHTAQHPTVALELAVIVDVSAIDHRDEMLALWTAA